MASTCFYSMKYMERMAKLHEYNIIGGTYVQVKVQVMCIQGDTFEILFRNHFHNEAKWKGKKIFLILKDLNFCILEN